MRKIYLSLIFMCCFFVGHAQFVYTPEEQLKMADTHFDKYEYAEAAQLYRKLVRGDKTDNYINIRLGDCYYNIFNTVESAKWYGKALAVNPNLEGDIYYRYAQMLKASGRYEAANKAFKKFADRNPDDSRAIEFLKEPNYIPSLRSQEALFTFEDSGMNHARYSDFAGVLTEDNTFYFTTARNERGKKYGWDEQPYLDVFAGKYNLEDGKFTEIEPVDEINTKKYHDGPVTITKDGQTMYFSSESFRDKKYDLNKEKRLKLGKVNVFRAKFNGKKWGDIEPVPFNGAEYSVSNPSVSPDGKTLYFASDMPGTFGGMDIWKVSVDEDGNYGEPENMGPAINTEGRESFPFIAENGKLYYSSDALQGFGGLDVYMIDLESPGATPVNLGDPVNTQKDDFAMSFYPEKNIGFLSTNRVGRDDIYKVFPVCVEEFVITVTDAKTGNILKDSEVSILDHDGNIIDTRFTDSFGIVRYDVDCQRNFSLQVTRPDYENKTIELERTKGGKKPVDVSIRPIEMIVLPKKIELGDIYFEFNKSNITQQGAFELNKLVQIMQNNPTMRIKIEAHTDNRGSDAYNLNLSQQRAMATRQYLISQGISPDRLEAQGYGESSPAIDCGENCTDEQHAMNRRSEFIILRK